MKKYLYLGLFALFFSVSASAHQPFTLVSSEKTSVKADDLAQLEKGRTNGTLKQTNLTFAEKEVRLVVFTGPEDDMLSYRIQGVRNPNLILPAGAVLKILFINLDSDMRHDVRFGHIIGEFGIAPETEETAGTSKLTARTEDGMLQAEEIVIRSNETGSYKYFCSVRGHAKGGMWSNIFVGVKPGADVKNAEKTAHVHSTDEEKDDDHPADEKVGASKSSESEKKSSEIKAAIHTGHKMTPQETKPDTKPEMARMDHSGHGGMEMRSTVNIGEPMSREGSGTSWLPDSSPMHAFMKMYEDGGMLMLHGNMFLRYTQIGSSRDVSAAGKGSRNRFDAPSMFMAMYSRPISKKSQIGLRAMMSLDPLLERGYGYPLLFQSGELYRGEPLHDRQHPHDLFSELAATYSYKFDDKNSFFVYAGYPGEPAIGPPAFMHRPSAANNPDAPIGHHWQDATHITFGVVTAGFTHKNIKFEASAFKGTEPDENRWNFDAPKLNSFSGRLSWNPTKEWAFQVSHAYLKYPERSEPDLKVMRRTTASAIFNKKINDDTNWSNSMIWGQNHSDEGRSNSFLFESNYEFDKNAVFGRFEQVQKNAHELVLPAPHPEGNFWVGAYSLGYLRELVKGKGIDVGIGAMATFNTNPDSISGFYGGTKHGGGQIFLRFRPSLAR